MEQEQTIKVTQGKVYLLKGDSIPVDKKLSSDIQKAVDQHKVVDQAYFWEQQVGFHCYSVAWSFTGLKISGVCM